MDRDRAWNGNADKVEKLFRSKIMDEYRGRENTRDRATIDVIVSLDAFSFVEIDDETVRLVVARVSDKEFFHGFGKVYKCIYYIYIVCLIIVSIFYLEGFLFFFFLNQKLVFANFKNIKMFSTRYSIVLLVERCKTSKNGNI